MKPTIQSADEFRAAQGLPKAGRQSKVRTEWVYTAFDVAMPPSVNHAYFTGSHGRRVLTKDGRDYKDGVTTQARRACDGRCAPTWVTLTIELHISLLYKNGKIRTWDASNRVKLLEDAVCEGYDIDDSRVRRLVVEKFNSTTEWARVILTSWKDEG